MVSSKAIWISCCHWVYGFVWVRAAAKGLVWVYGPIVANHQQYCQYQESGPLYGAMLDSESLTAIRPTQISTASTATWCHCDIQTWAAIKGHVLVHGPTAVRVYIDVHGLWYHLRTHGYPGSGPQPVGILLSEAMLSRGGQLSHMAPMV